MRDRGVVNGASAVGTLVGKQAKPVKAKRDRSFHTQALRNADEIQRVVNRYAENPRANAKRLRELGLTPHQIRTVHRERVGANPAQRRLRYTAKHPEAMGPIGGGIGIGANLLKDTASAAKGFVPGLYQAGRAGYHDTGALLHGNKPTHVYRDVLKPIGKSYAYTYGPATRGDFGKTLHRIGQHPLGPALDLASIFTGGTSAGIKAGLIKAPARERGLALEAGGKKIVQPHASPNPLRRKAQHAYDRYSERHPETPAVGASSRITRRVPFERERAHERRLVKGIKHKAALDKLKRKPGQQIAYTVLLDYGSKAGRRLDQEIAMRTRRMKTHPREAADQARNIVQLKLARKHVEAPSPALREAVSTGRALSLHTQGEKIKLGYISEESAAERVGLHSRLITGGKVEKTPPVTPKIQAARARVARLENLVVRAEAREFTTSPKGPSRLPEHLGGRGRGPQAQRLGAALSVAKDELQRLEASYAKRHGFPAGANTKETVRLVGGEGPGEGAAYIPDIAPRRAGPAAVRRARSILGRPRKPDYAKRSEGVLFTTGRARKGAQLTYEDFQRTVRDIARVEDTREAAKLSKRLSEDPAHPGGLEPGHVYYNPAGVRIPQAAREAAARQEVENLTPREIAQGDADLHRMLMENVFPSRDAFARMTPKQRARVRQIKAEHAAAFGAEPAGRFGGHGVAALLGEIFDTANNITRAALLYLKGSYVPANHVGNDLFGVLKQGPFYFKNLAAVSERFGKRTPEILHRYDIETGTTASQSMASGRGLLKEKLHTLAEFSSRHADRGPRRAAMEYELGKRGYKTNAQIEDLFRRVDAGEAKATAVLNQISESAEKSMVQFRGLSRAQRDLVSRAIFVWPWVRGATKWMGNYALDHPLRADLTAHLGEEGHDYVWSKLGGLVSYVDGLIPLGKAERKLGTTVVPVSNPGSVTPFGTGSDFLQTLAGFTNHPAARTFNLGEMANPLITGGVESAYRINTQTGFAYPAGMPWWKIAARNTVEQFPAVRAAEIAASKPPEPFTGSPAKQRLYVPEHGILDALKAIGLGPARKRYLNLPASQAKAKAERHALMPSDAVVAEDFVEFEGKIKQAIHSKYGHTTIPRPIKARLDLWHERVASRRRAGNNWEEHAAADIDLAAQHGWITVKQAETAKNRLARIPQDKRGSFTTFLTATFFDRDDMLKDSLGHLGLKRPKL